MANQDNIKNELRSMNSALPVNNSQPFSVPEGYFNGLASSILSKINNQGNTTTEELKEISPLLAGISKEMPLSVPLFYFEENLKALPAFTREEHSALLTAIGKDLPFTVPAGYFEGLAASVANGIERPTAKVVPLFSRKWMRMAVAVVIGAAMFITGYQYYNQPVENSSAGLVPANDTSGQNLVAKNDPAVVEDIKNSTTKELDDFIKNVPVNTPKTEVEKPNSIVETEVEVLLKDVTATEMDAFLDQVPTDDEELIVIN